MCLNARRGSLVLKSQTKHTRDIRITNSAGNSHTISEYVVCKSTLAGGKEKWYEAERFYRGQNGANIPFRPGPLFNFPGTGEFVSEDE
jgi:hypothetical protein